MNLGREPLHPRDHPPRTRSRAASERRTHGAETGAEAQLRGKGCRGSARAEGTPRGAAASAGGEAACGRLDFPAGKEGDRTGPVLLLELSARQASQLGVSCLPRQGTPLEMWAWGAAGLAGSRGSAQVSGGPQGLGTPQTGAGPGRCFPRPRGPQSLRISPPGDPLARVPALPTGDHPPGPLWRGEAATATWSDRASVTVQSYKTALYSAFSSREIMGLVSSTVSRTGGTRAPRAGDPRGRAGVQREPDTLTALPLPTPTVDGPHDSEIVL